MNGTEITNQAIPYSSEELDTLKAQMAAMIDNVLGAVSQAKSAGMDRYQILAGADTAIRGYLRKIQGANTKDYKVMRSGSPVLVGVDANGLVALTEAEIKERL